MKWFSAFRGRRASEAQLDRELWFHVERLVEEKIAAGVAPEDARREALIEFGGREQWKEELRDVHRIATFENTISNVKSGIHFMGKYPSFSITVVLTLALGVGANSAVFSTIDAILLRPLPFPKADELMVLNELDRKAKSPSTFVAPVRLEDWNRLNTTFQTISGWYTQDASETSGPLPERVTEALVAPRFLEVWGVEPALGRDFAPEEEHFGGRDAVLISDRLWRRRFHADPSVIGKTLRLEKYSFSIVGVMPASFRFPDHDVDAWTVSAPDAPYAQDRSSTWFTVFGRLKPGVTVAQARANLTTVQAQLGRQFPKTDVGLGVDVQPLKETTVAGVRRSLWVLFGSVSLLLLIACTNIAALLLARTTERAREISIRFSLGASRAAIVAQLLTECLLLAVLGSGAGLMIAIAGVKGMRTLGATLPRMEEISLDWRIVVYALACAGIATLLSGLFPAIRGTRRTIAEELAQGGRTQVSTQSRGQWMLVGVQVALAVVLLVGAGLLLRSFEELGRVSPGFETGHVLTLHVSGNWGETADMKKLTQRVNHTLDALRSVPGVRAAATSAMLPGIPSDTQTEVRVSEGRADTDGKIVGDSRFVSSGYFATMQIPVLAGEGCRESMNTNVVVNRSFAGRYFGDSPAIGHHLELGTNPFNMPPAEIRGVVADAREQGLDRAPGPTIYWCLSAPTPTPNYLVRTQGDPMAIAGVLRRKIHQIEPGRSVFDISPLDEHLSNNFAETRLRTVVLTLFAATAVLLACVGLYGTLSYFVATRRREVALRLALGAVRGQIAWQFLLKALTVAVVGCVAGLCMAAAATRGLAGMLYGVSRLDTTTFVSVVCLIIAVAAVASSAPCIRAALLEPMKVLRDE